MLKSAAVAVARARSAIGMQIEYKLGRGGMHPERNYPHNSDQHLDCSGFIAWVFWLCRKTENPFYKQQNGGWIETSALAADIRANGQGLFTPPLFVMPGDILVWPDAGARQGHVGIVSATKDSRASKIIHCSSSNYRRYGKAVAETDAELFYKMKALCGRYIHWVP